MSIIRCNLPVASREYVTLQACLGRAGAARLAPNEARETRGLLATPEPPPEPDRPKDHAEQYPGWNRVMATMQGL
jgi:hypothetical protein